MTLTEEDFSAWRDNHVTQALFKALAVMREEARDEWLKLSWVAGNPDPLQLATLRAGDQILADIIEISFEDLESKLEPVEGN
jgi:hypothetical protein